MTSTSTSKIGHDLIKFDEGYAPATQRAYASDWKEFLAWCRRNDHQTFLIGSETIAAYVESESEQLKPATVCRRLVSIAAIHRDRDMVDPTKARIVRIAVKRMFRFQGRRQHQAAAITFEMLQSMLKAGDNDIIGKRNKALLATAYDSGCRRSELVKLFVDDLERDDDGSATILMLRSKTDQEGRGQMRYLAADTVRLIDSWLNAAEIRSGLIFHSVNRHGQVRGTSRRPLHDRIGH